MKKLLIISVMAISTIACASENRTPQDLHETQEPAKQTSSLKTLIREAMIHSLMKAHRVSRKMTNQLDSLRVINVPTETNHQAPEPTNPFNE